MITAPKHPPQTVLRTNALPTEHPLEEYRIAETLGAGGFGVTYKAFDTLLETWVAIKEYFPIEWSFRAADGVMVEPNTQGQFNTPHVSCCDYEWGLERFLEEARVLARVQHPYVVRIKRYFRANGTAYIVMDYEEGQPLSAILQEGTTLTEEEIRGLLEDILPALQAVHEQGYLHRDIKPSNLYVRASDQRVILIDFGAARSAVGHHSRSITSLVTPGYSPPEQYTTRIDRHGPWSDLYAVGAVMYRCVTGHTPMEAAERLMGDTLQSAMVAGAGRYSKALLETIDRALAIRWDNRFRDIARMQAALTITDTDLTPLVQGREPRADTGAPSPPTRVAQETVRNTEGTERCSLSIRTNRLTISVRSHDVHPPVKVQYATKRRRGLSYRTRLRIASVALLICVGITTWSWFKAPTSEIVAPAPAVTPPTVVIVTPATLPPPPPRGMHDPHRPPDQRPYHTDEPRPPFEGPPPMEVYGPPQPPEPPSHLSQEPWLPPQPQETAPAASVTPAVMRTAAPPQPMEEATPPTAPIAPEKTTAAPENKPAQGVYDMPQVQQPPAAQKMQQEEGRSVSEKRPAKYRKRVQRATASRHRRDPWNSPNASGFNSR